MSGNPLGTIYPISTLISLGNYGSPTAATGMIVNANHEMVAFKYLPTTTSPIEKVNIYFDITGTVTGTDWTYEVWSNTAGTTYALDVPNAVLGATGNCKVAAFAGPAADGWSGDKTFAETSGNLTIGTPVWIVVQGHDNSGTLDGSNYVNFCRPLNSPTYGGYMRHHDGTNWTNTTGVSSMGSFVVTHADGSLGGGYYTSGSKGSSGKHDVYGTYGQCMRVKFGSKVTIYGCYNSWITTGSPSTLQLAIYKGADVVLAAFDTTITATNHTDVITFFSPVTLDADTYYYFLFRQKGGGGSDSADYDMQTLTTTSAYYKACSWEEWAFGYGDGADCTAYTFDMDRIPIPFVLYIGNPAEDLDCDAGGGGAPRFGDMTGGLK